MSVEEKYLDVLQNLEFAIQLVYKEHPELIDYDVQFAVEALIEFYTAEERNREPRNFNLSGNSEKVYRKVKKMCNYRLGISKSEADLHGDSPHAISRSEILICLKKIKKSIETWTKRNGRQGYLNFLKQFMP